MRGLVSVVVPTIGRRSLSRTLDTIRKQSYRPIETWVVPDYDRRGACWARNQGAARANGEFLFFCDDDVALERRAIGHLVRALRLHGKPAYAYGWMMIGGSRVGYQRFDARKLRRKNFVSTHSLVRAELFPGFEEQLGRWQDWELWLRMLEKNQVGIFVDTKILTTSTGRDGISRDSRALRHARHFLRERHRVW